MWAELNRLRSIARSLRKNGREKQKERGCPADSRGLASIAVYCFTMWRLCLRRRGAARRLVRKGKRWSLPGQDQLAETLVPSAAEERCNHLAILQVRIARVRLHSSHISACGKRTTKLLLQPRLQLHCRKALCMHSQCSLAADIAIPSAAIYSIDLAM